MDVADVVREQLSEEAKAPLNESERLAAQQLFQKYDSDGNGSIDAVELRNLLRTEFKMTDAGIDGVMVKFDANKDGKIDFAEFCALCQFNRNALVMGLAMDMLTAAAYAKWGCYCCLCTACLSWCCYCCKVKQIEQKLRDNTYQTQAMRSAQPVPSPAAATGTAAPPDTAAAAAAADKPSEPVADRV